MDIQIHPRVDSFNISINENDLDNYDSNNILIIYKCIGISCIIVCFFSFIIFFIVCSEICKF